MRKKIQNICYLKEGVSYVYFFEIPEFFLLFLICTFLGMSLLAIETFNQMVAYAIELVVPISIGFMIVMAIILIVMIAGNGRIFKNSPVLSCIAIGLSTATNFVEIIYNYHMLLAIRSDLNQFSGSFELFLSLFYGKYSLVGFLVFIVFRMIWIAAIASIVDDYDYDNDDKSQTITNMIVIILIDLLWIPALWYVI